MSSHRKLLVPCSSSQSTGTNNLARTICGLQFVLRYVTFSKCSNLRRSKVVELLDERNIQHSPVDLVRFSWTEENRDDEGDEDDGEDSEDGGDIEIEIAPYRTVITTPVTIWVGVLPDTLTGEVAFNSSNSSRSTGLPTSMSRTVSRWSRASVVPDCSPPSTMTIPSRPSSTLLLQHSACLSLA